MSQQNLSMLMTLQSYIRDRDHMFDRDLILDKLNSFHHQAQNLLLRFKARVIERSADITKKFLDSRSKCSLALLFLCVLSVTGLDLSHALPADLFRRHARSPKGHH